VLGPFVLASCCAAPLRLAACVRGWAWRFSASNPRRLFFCLAVFPDSQTHAQSGGWLPALKVVMVFVCASAAEYVASGSPGDAWNFLTAKRFPAAMGGSSFSMAVCKPAGFLQLEAYRKT